MRGRLTIAVLATLVVGVTVGIFLRSSGIVGPRVRAAAPLAASIAGEGENGLTPADRGSFYHLSEGGELFPLDWFLALEVEYLAPDGALEARPFMDNIERYGLLPDAVSKGNPYGVPVGISVGTSKLMGSQMIGLNCAACHVGQFQYQNRAVRIDGGPNMVLINKFLTDMSKEAEATFENPRRLARFWNRVREIRKARRAANDGVDPAAPDESLFRRIWHLVTQNRDLLEAQVGNLKRLPILQNEIALGDEEGYGRLDAFGIGRDELTGGVPGNMLPPDAPVSLPHIWGLAYTGWIQWGANTNSVMERNIGQALGVGAIFDKNYRSTVKIENLHAMEDFAYKIQPPDWPEFFPAIDRAKAARGEQLFKGWCAGCHETWPPSKTLMRSYNMKALAEVGTDPLTAIGFERPVMLKDGTVTPFALAASTIIKNVKATAYVEANLTPADIAKLEQRQIRFGPEWDPVFRPTLLDSEDWPDSKGKKVYRSKTLVGIWATPPFLHNGSVPTLWDLLHYSKDRPVTFTTGQREYDPVKLGLQTDPSKYTLAVGLDPFTFDTRRAGNWNTGHEWDFYKDLDDEKRYAIIEYLKTHNDHFDPPPPPTKDAIDAALAASPIAPPVLPVATALDAPRWPWVLGGLGGLLVFGLGYAFVQSLSANAAKYSAQEPADIDAIRAGVLKLQASFAADQDRPLRRGTHAKGRCVTGTFEVFDLSKTIPDSALAARLAQALFAKPGVYPATIRFANGNSQIQRDKVGDVRACSFAAELPGGGRHDFAMNNANIFPINDAHAFATLIKFATAPSPFRGFRSLRLSEKMAFLRIAFLGAIESRPPKVAYQLTRYWSTVPFCHGPADAVKYSLMPCSGNTAHPLDGSANELQNEIARHVTNDDHMSAFDFGIQFLDTAKMRRWGRRRETGYWIENASIPWNEKQSPFHVVGRLTLAKGSLLSEEATEAQFIDVTTNSTPETAPLGSINRARWAAESASRKARLG
jgi:hypothetical protein